MTSLRGLLCATMLLGLTGDTVAQSVAPIPESVPAVRLIVVAARLIMALDGPTTVVGPANVVAWGQASLDSRLHLVTTYRIQDMVLEKEFTNQVLGWEVPGRRVHVKIRVDCDVAVWIDLQRLRIHKDPDFPDTLAIVLPGPRKITAEFPEGTLADFQVTYGWLRSRFLDDGKARDLRKGLYKDALDLASRQYQNGFEQTRRQLADQVQAELRRQFPRHRIYVRWD